MFMNDGKMVMTYDFGKLAPSLCEEKALLRWGFALQGKKWMWLVAAGSRSEYISLEVKVIVMKRIYNWELFVCLLTHFYLRQVAFF
ncbi:hypothetical protein BDA96_08G103300 [Sorghum bicolor]|jgi:hypothetical protein|uniref:Uncharacterized protein n=1 Tax=Sorghum bicolor TaxID=4558 RepID=A0A921QHT8_SORBI|nr:hypothetical protein BDA96_08G103300 [Sorghum bicolor]